MNLDLVSEAKQKMRLVLGVLNGDLATVRTGRATPTLVENVVISSYGGSSKLKIMELATIVVSDPHTLF